MREKKEQNQKNQNSKKNSSNFKISIILTLIMLIGLGIMLYPTVSDWWNSFHSTRLVENYVDTISQMDDNHYEEYLEAARIYNESRVGAPLTYALTDKQKEEYLNLLDITGTGMMGYISIESIDVMLPIYHGTETAVLQQGIGHMEWSSLPVGGESTHCVLSGHRGLPSAKLFTDLNLLTEGDTFQLNILEEILTYEIDQILIVEPRDTEELLITPGEDYCTLVTCTPYGINTQRILARGHRIETHDTHKVRVVSDAFRVSTLVVASIVAIPLILLLLAADSLITKWRRQSFDEDER